MENDDVPTNKIYNINCTDCNGKGGMWDCGWWYECPVCEENGFETKQEKE